MACAINVNSFVMAVVAAVAAGGFCVVAVAAAVLNVAIQPSFSGRYGHYTKATGRYSGHYGHYEKSKHLRTPSCKGSAQETGL